MFRALLFSTGCFLALCGGLLLCVERVVLTQYATDRLRRAVPTVSEPAALTAGDGPDAPTLAVAASAAPPDDPPPPSDLPPADPDYPEPLPAPPAWKPRYAVARADEATVGHEVIDPPDWAGFALLSIGGVTLMYAVALPGRRREWYEDDHHHGGHHGGHHGHGRHYGRGWFGWGSGHRHHSCCGGHHPH